MVHYSMEESMRIFGRVLLVMTISLLLSGAAQAQKRGKVYFSTTAVKDISPKALKKQFRGSKPIIELKRNKDKKWEVTVVAFFSRKCHPGPITLWLYDKDDKAALKAKDPVNAISVNNKQGPTKIWVHNFLIDPDLGFNKNRSYILMVGQIINGRNKVYAKGIVDLKP